jgi:hypothetical protein
MARPTTTTSVRQAFTHVYIIDLAGNTVCLDEHWLICFSGHGKATANAIRITGNTRERLDNSEVAPLPIMVGRKPRRVG